MMFNNKIIFITGGTGTWGQAIIKNLLLRSSVKQIIIFSRGEDKQVSMEREFNNNKLKFILGDVRNKNLLSKYSKGSDYIIHLAALKHISKCEENNSEAIGINIVGTQNIIDVAIENKIKKVLYISTDKAVEPYNLYGNTKAISEKLITNANNYINNDCTIFYTIRAGNILGSNGSVIKLFHQQIKDKKPLTITDLSMKRFYVPIDEIVDLIFYSFGESIGGEIFILKGEVFSLKDILNIMIDIYGYGNEKIIELGMKKGEKRNEILISNNEINKTFFINNKYFLIDNLGKVIDKKEKVSFDEYSTKTENNNSMTILKNSIINLFGI